MTLKEKLLLDIKKSMKSSNKEVLETLRLLHSAIKNQEIKMRPKELSDTDYLLVVQKIAKQMKESMVEFEKAGRKDLYEKEERQYKIISTYLPQPLSEEEVRKLIEDVVKKCDAHSMKDMGKVMKELGSLLKGRADNHMVSQLVKKKLHAI